jgi:predicted esterase
MMLTYHALPAPLKPIRYLFIFLHGLGDKGESWADFFPSHHTPLLQESLCIFPNAPIIPITLNNEMKMPGWYNIWTLSEPPPSSFSLEMLSATSHDAAQFDDVKGFEKSAKLLDALITHLCQQHAISKSSNIILGGTHRRTLCRREF